MSESVEKHVRKHCDDYCDDDDEVEQTITEEELAEERRQVNEKLREEEEKLKARYPALKGTGSSELLQKRLSRGNKYFDSGDYNMAKAKVGPGAKLHAGQKPTMILGQTGEAIPTPETVPHKKVGPLQSKLANPS